MIRLWPTRNPSNGSGFSDTGSMERAKLSAANAVAAADKRKKLDESKESRIDAKQVIDDLIKSANLGHDDSQGGMQIISFFLIDY